MSSTGSNGNVTPSIALTLLQSLQAADTPEERLKDEDVQQSLPRRLGLSTVVTTQIRRYAELDRDRGHLPAREVVELFQLVSRRPDAASVFASTGRRLAARDLRRRSRGVRWLGPRLPQPMRRLLCLRSVHRIARQLAPPGGARLEGKPPALVVRGGLLAQACLVSLAENELLRRRAEDRELFETLLHEIGLAADEIAELGRAGVVVA